MKLERRHLVHRMSRIGMIAFIALAAAGVALAAPVKVTGVLVDQGCYMKDHANTTMAHKGMSETCAADCAKKGQPVALVTDKGEMYEVMAMGSLAGDKNAKLIPHMSHTVT